MKNINVYLGICRTVSSSVHPEDFKTHKHCRNPFKILCVCVCVCCFRDIMTSSSL